MWNTLTVFNVIKNIAVIVMVCIDVIYRYENSRECLCSSTIFSIHFSFKFQWNEAEKSKPLTDAEKAKISTLKDNVKPSYRQIANEIGRDECVSEIFSKIVRIMVKTVNCPATIDFKNIFKMERKPILSPANIEARLEMTNAFTGKALFFLIKKVQFGRSRWRSILARGVCRDGQKNIPQAKI